MDRRTVLKSAGIGSAAFAAGCNSHPEKHLYTQVRAPEDLVIGEPLWYTSTCRECPAGCGVLAKNREERVIKLKGNPMHTIISRGKLCARGQAALQRLYHPDRIRKPRYKSGKGWQEISFGQALALIQQRATNVAVKGLERVAMLTEVVGSDLQDLFEGTLSLYRPQGPVAFEPLAYESLKFAMPICSAGRSCPPTGWSRPI